MKRFAQKKSVIVQTGYFLLTELVDEVVVSYLAAKWSGRNGDGST